MTEMKPLNELSGSNIRIVTQTAVNSAQIGNRSTSHKSQLIAEDHIQAPCCRDIHDRNEPPDGGMRAWLVMISAFICNGIIFGIINTYGIIHKLLTDRLEEQGDKEASSKAALVGSLTIGTTFLLSPVAGCLTDKIGLRVTTLIGGLLSASGLILSSLFTESISALYLTYGIMFGLGAALAYTPTLAILGHYFKRYLGKVSGFVTAGSSVFTVILPPGLDYLLTGYGLEQTLQIMALVSCFIVVCSFVYKPLHPPPQPPQKKPGRSRLSMLIRSIINVSIWKRKKYVIWALCVPMALFGYFVPYVHMMKFVQKSFPGKSENLPVMCIGVTSGIGRLIFGVIADLPGVNRIYLQQLALICIGFVTLLLPLTSSYILLIIFTLIMGLFDGCFISLLGPIAYEICGPSGATQAIGFLLGLSSFPLTIGPPIAGKIYDSTGSYMLPLLLAGIPPILGSLIMFLIRCVQDEDDDGNNLVVKTTREMENGCNELERETISPKTYWNENDINPNESLINRHANGTNALNTDNETTKSDKRTDERKTHSADTGIKTRSFAQRISTALCELQLAARMYTALAYSKTRRIHITNSYHTSVNTALLEGNRPSKPLTEDQTKGIASDKLNNLVGDNLTEQRSYTYSIY